jgi:hypothetical protein
MFVNLSLERLRFFPTPNEVFTLRADPLESRGSPQSDMRKEAGGPPPRMNSARVPWHKGGRPEGLLAKKSVGGESTDAWRTGAERGPAAGPRMISTW